MAPLDDTPIARAVSVTGCPSPTCTCGSLIVRLFDAHGQVLAGAVLPKTVADVFAAHVAALTAPPAASDLSTIRCQGVA